MTSPARQPSSYSLVELMSVGGSSFYRLLQDMKPSALNRLDFTAAIVPRRHGTTNSRAALPRKLYRRSDPGGGVRIVVQAPVDAADEDTATGGPDAARRLCPAVAVINEYGYAKVPEGRGCLPGAAPHAVRVPRHNGDTN